MHQPNLFDDAPSYTPADPTVPDEARPRLSGQCQRILERLKRGPASNTELTLIALRYSARIHELRKLGHRIECVEHDKAKGVTVYELK